MTTRYRMLTAVLGLGALLFGTGVSIAQSAPSGQLKPITFRLDWTWGAQHAGYVVAKALGYYKDAGLDVTISEGEGSSVTAKLVAAGRADVGVISAGETLIARSNGLPLRAIATVVQESPTAILYNADKIQLSSLKELYGHSLAVTTASTTYKEWQAIVSLNKVDMTQIREVSAGAAANQSFISGKIDTQIGLSYLDVPVAAAAGINIKYLPLKKFGLDIPFSALVSSETFIDESPDTLRAFIKATDRGWKYVKENPEKALDIFYGVAREADPASNNARLPIFLPMLGDNFGVFDANKWNSLRDIYKSAGMLAHDVDLNTVYTDKFLQ